MPMQSMHNFSLDMFWCYSDNRCTDCTGNCSILTVSTCTSRRYINGLGKWFNALLNYWLLFEWSTTVHVAVQSGVVKDNARVARAKLEVSRNPMGGVGKSSLMPPKCARWRDGNCARFISPLFFSSFRLLTEHFLFDPSIETFASVTNRACSFDIWFSRILRIDEFQHEHNVMRYIEESYNATLLPNMESFALHVSARLQCHKADREEKRKALFVQLAFFANHYIVFNICKFLRYISKDFYFFFFC